MGIGGNYSPVMNLGRRFNITNHAPETQLGRGLHRRANFRAFTENMKAFALGCLAAFMILEITLRCFNAFEMRIQGDRIFLPKNRHYKILNTSIPGLDRYITHTKNSLGLRGAELPPNAHDGLLFVTVGGSTTECFYISDGQTWPDLLGKKMSSQFNHFYVNNAGLDGHSTFGHIILMNGTLCRLKPNFVLFLVGNNDVGRDDLRDFDRNGIKETATAFFRHRILTKSRVLSFLYILIMKNKTINHSLNHSPLNFQTKINVPDGERSRLLEVHRTKHLKGYEERLQHLIDLSKQCSIQPLLVTQPALYGTAKDPVTGTDLSKIDVHGIDGETAWKVLELYNEVTRRVAKRNQVFLIDLAQQMPKSSEFFYDAIHFTNAGASKVAQIIYQSLCPYIAEHKKEFLNGSCSAGPT